MSMISRNLIYKKRERSSLFLLWSSMLHLFLANGCGTETGNPIINRPKTPKLIAQDTTESELSELAESVLDNGPIPPTPTIGSYFAIDPAALMLQSTLELASSSSNPHPAPALQLNSSFSCTGDQNRVSGSVVRKIETSKQFRKSSVTVSKVTERQHNFTYESPLGALSCSQDRGVQFKAQLLEGTLEAREGFSKRSVNRSGEVKAKHYKTAEFTSSGKRTRKYDRVVIGTSSIYVERSNEWNLDKKIRVSTAEGDSTDESKSMTAPGKPIKIAVELSKDESSVSLSKTIQSGTTLTTRSDGSQVEISFENVLLIDKECYPASGVLRGKITPATNSGLQPEIFTIDFGDKNSETPEITFADGDKVQLSGNCLAD